MLNETNTWIGGVCTIGGFILAIVTYKDKKKTNKINNLEKRRDMFYIHIRDALKLINMSELRHLFSDISNDYGKKEHDEMHFTQTIAAMFSDYLKKHDKLMSECSNLATAETKEYLDGFFDVYQQSVSTGSMIDYFKDFEQYYFRENTEDRNAFAIRNENNFFNYYVLTKLQIEEDIRSINDELAKLVKL